MNISKVSQANLKQFNLPLKEGKNALIKFSDNSLECLITKDNHLLGGYGHQSPKGIHSDEVLQLHAKLKDSIQEGVDFFKEFTKAVFAK